MTVASRKPVGATRWLAIAFTASLSSVAFAQQAPAPAPNPPSAAPSAKQQEADAAFKQGRELVKSGNYIDACEQFQRSQQLDPQLGTLFNIAQCSEKVGKLATAAAAYRELVAKDHNAERKMASASALEALQGRIPTIVAKVEKPPPGITITLDSKAGSRAIEPNRPIEADFGEYTLVARAKGYTEMISRFRIGDEGSTKVIEVTLLPGASNSDILAQGTRSGDVAQPASKRKLIGIAVGATGGAALVGGIVVGVLARNQWNDARAICGGATCSSRDDLDRANVLADAARTKANLSTGLVIGGAVLAGAGVALWLTAPGQVQIAPTATDSGAGVSLSGAFW